MKTKLFFLISIILISIACRNDINKMNKNPELNKEVEGNIFRDEVLQNIYNLQDERSTLKLLKYLKNEYPEYRKAAANAFASIQDSASIIPLSTLLKDDNEEVRSVVAYALGQIGNVAAEPVLISAYEAEKSLEVKKQILEAIGKCGTTVGLQFITNLTINSEDLVLLTGQAWGLTRFAFRGVISEESTGKAVYLLTSSQISEKIKFIISHYFARGKGLNLTNWQADIVKGFNQEGYVYTQINLALALGKSTNIESLRFLHKIINQDYDYRIKVNAINACKNFSYELSRDLMFNMLTNNDVNIAIKASEFFLEKGNETDANLYYNNALKLSKWQTRANMLSAALKYAKDKQYISNSIISGYQVAENIYEKAALLKALAGNPMVYKFVEEQTFYANNVVLSSSGIETLAEMRNNPDFDTYNTKNIAEKGDNLYEEFALIFKKAIQSQDVAMISTAAGVICNPKFNYREQFNNTYFLNQALNNCQMPQDYEAYTELKKAIEYINNTQVPEPIAMPRNPINWKLVTSISPNQKVIIKTTKGDILIQLLVNQAPGSVSNFVKLIKENYFQNSVFHRVVPNFVIQDGCPRGDGWGSAAFTIRSEYPQLYYEEGSVGMASSGKDTESCQWFITHYPTAQLDGRYSIFGTVVDGMEHVHNIEIGDKILAIELQ